MPTQPLPLWRAPFADLPFALTDYGRDLLLVFPGAAFLDKVFKAERPSARFQLLKDGFTTNMRYMEASGIFYGYNDNVLPSFRKGSAEIRECPSTGRSSRLLQ